MSDTCVQKHLKRKEYPTSLDFANDVELVFSNALEFNMEHTPIWEDAIVLRVRSLSLDCVSWMSNLSTQDYFRQLMSDLPPPYSIPAYASPDHSTKIKLKMPTATHGASVVAAGANSAAGPSQIAVTASPKLRLPAATSVYAQGPTAAAPSSTATSAPSMTGTTTPMVPPAHPTPAPQTVQYSAPTMTSPIISVQAATFNQQAYAYAQQKQQNGQTSYQAAAAPSLPNTNNIHVNPGRIAAKAQHISRSPVVQTTVPQVSRQPPPVKIPNQIPPSLMAAKSPTPVTMQNRRQLRSVTVVTWPFGRRIDLDHKDGVRIWSTRLGPGETSVHIGDVKFLSLKGGEDEESSDEEEANDKDKDKTQSAPATETAERHEEEEEDPEEAQEPPQEKPQKRGRGRPRKRPKSGKTASEASPKGKGKAKAAEVPQDEVQVRWNNTIVAPLQDEHDKEKETWEVALRMGSNTVDIGEQSGVVWRMYLDRTSAA